MQESDFNYMSDGFMEAFNGDIGREVYYISCQQSSRNKFGEFTFVYPEENKIKLNVIFSREAQVDGDVADNWTGRINANCTFINKQLNENGIVLKERDALDVTTNGVTQRFLITGFKKDPVLIEIFTKASVTDLEHAFKK